MTRMLTLIRRDLLSTGKDAVLLYALVAPLLIALGLRLFLPSVGQATVNVVVTPDLPPGLAERLADYFHVETVADRVALERRVLAFDDTAGIAPDGQGGYMIVLEGNETHDTELLPELALRRLLAGAADAPSIAMAEVAAAPFPFREVFGAFLALSALVISSTVMGLMIVEDKESRVMLALGVSPLARSEYIAARSLLAFGLALLVTFGSLWLLGVTAFDHLQLLAALLATLLVAGLMGFLVGAISANQIAAIANLKFGILLFLLPALLTLVLPERFWLALAWLPTYWAFAGFRAILVEGVDWPALGLLLLGNLLVSLVYIAVAYPWLKTRLDFARN